MSPLKSILTAAALISSALIAVAQDDATRREIAGLPAMPEIVAPSMIAPARADAPAQASSESSAIAENAYDFNAPNGVPGFGPMSPADVAKVLDARSAQ